MNVDTTKDQVQRDGLARWYNNGCKGRLEYATGTGKTRCGVLAAEYVVGAVGPHAKILVLTWMTTIRDKVWENEFHRWGKGHIWKNNVQSYCIQTAYRWENEHFDLVIADELHALLGDAQSLFFYNNNYDRLLGLTAYLPSDKEEEAETVGAPLMRRIPLEEAREKELIPDHLEIAVPIDMEEEEASKYKAVESRFQHLTQMLGGKEWAYKRATSLMRKYKGRKLDSIQDQKIRGHVRDAREYWRIMQARSSLIHKSMDKVSGVEQILDMGIGPSVIFFMSNDAVDELCKRRSDVAPYTSKNLGDKKDDNLEKWSRGAFKHIATCKKLNEGIDIPKVNYAIIAGTNSKRKDRVQRTGRVLRNDGENVPVVFDVYLRGTQEEQWLNNSLGLDKMRVKWLGDADELKAQDLMVQT